MRSDASLAAALLAQRLVDASAPPLKASEYWAVLDRVPDLGRLLGADAGAVEEATGMGPELAERIVALLGAATAFAFELDRVEQSGVRVVASVDEDYPAALLTRLGRTAPPALYVAGDAGLLTGGLLGIVGSRDVAEEGAQVAQVAQVAQDAARAAAANGLGVVSAGVKGVDRLSMTAAVESGAPVVGALADSLLRTTRDPDVRRAITDGQLCLCTPYKPSAGFSEANAMGRNKLIYALSAATLVVAADEEKGGTWAGAVEALGQGRVPVLVWTGAGATGGNRRLAGMGAIGVDAVGGLFPLPQAPAEPPSAADQLALEV